MTPGTTRSWCWGPETRPDNKRLLFSGNFDSFKFSFTLMVWSEEHVASCVPWKLKATSWMRSRWSVLTTLELYILEQVLERESELQLKFAVVVAAACKQDAARFEKGRQNQFRGQQ